MKKLVKENYLLPKLFVYGKYIICFWFNEDDEPVHVHVSVKKQPKNSLKFWITKNGKVILANSKTNISNHEINKISNTIASQTEYIVEQWKEHFGEVSYYC